jgi:hypothetical protein
MAPTITIDLSGFSNHSRAEPGLLEVTEMRFPYSAEIAEADFIGSAVSIGFDLAGSF